MPSAPALLAALALLACAGGGPRFDPDAELTHDGLRRLVNTRFDRAFARPGLDLSRYQRIWLVSAGIEYTRPPEPTYGAARGFALEPLDREPLEAELLAALRAALFGDGAWKPAEIPGPEVLLLRASLIDVVIEAPPEPVSSRSDVLIRSAGSATLVLDLRDSLTREALVRVADRGEFEPATGPMRSTAITNRREVRRTFEAWAQLARRRLDELRTLRLPESPA
jgi:hypothetical protein